MKELFFVVVSYKNDTGAREFYTDSNFDEMALRETFHVFVDEIMISKLEINKIKFFSLLVEC